MILVSKMRSQTLLEPADLPCLEIPVITFKLKKAKLTLTLRILFLFQNALKLVQKSLIQFAGQMELLTAILASSIGQTA